MTTNNQILLEDFLEQKRSETSQGMDKGAFFEQFANDQILKNFNLSYEEIESGMPGGGGDGGVDGIYCFCDEILLYEDDKLDSITPRKNISLHLYIIQAKSKRGFQEIVIDRFTSFSNDIFDLSKDLES